MLEKLIIIIKKSGMDLGIGKVTKEKVIQWSCVYIFARKTGLELLNLAYTNTKIWWPEVEAEQI